MLGLPGYGIRSISRHLQTGAWAESQAVSWLLHRNWLVCKNVSGHGFVDLIATRIRGNGTKTILIDVKYYNAENRTYTRLNDKQRRAGVVILLVEGDGNCKFIEEDLPDEKDSEPDL